MAETTVPMDYAVAIQKAADATEQLRKQWENPALRMQARQLTAARVEYDRTVVALQRINQQESIRARTMDAQRRFGRVAGAVYGAGMVIGGSAVAQGAWAAAQRGAQYAQGMAQRGFGGTAEAARLGTEMGMLAREFAGVAKPFTDGLEKLTKSVRRAMESMDGDQQGRMLNVVGGVVAGGLALRYRSAIGGLIGGAANAVGLGGGGGLGMAARRVIGRAGPIGMAIGLGASALGYGSVNADEKNPYTRTFAEQNPELSKKFDGMNKQQLREYWNKNKESMRPSDVGAIANTLGTSVLNMGRWVANQVPIGERLKYKDEYSEYDQTKRELQRREAIGTREGRKAVTLPGGGISEAGSGYFALQSSFGAQQFANQNDGAGEDGGILGRIADAVDRIAGRQEVK